MTDENSIDDWNDDITQDSADFLFRKTQDVYREEEPEESEEAELARLHRAGAADADIDDLLAITSSPKPEEKERYTNKQLQGLLDQLNADEPKSDVTDSSDDASYYSCLEGSGGSAPEEDVGKRGSVRSEAGKSVKFLNPDSDVTGKSGSNVILIPKRFDGTGHWQSYKCHFLNCKEGNDWSDSEACRYLKARLDGDATMVLVQAGKNKTFSELLSALDTRYGVAAPKFVIKARLRNIYQGEDQSVQAFADELNSAVAGKPGMKTQNRPLCWNSFFTGYTIPK